MILILNEDKDKIIEFKELFGDNNELNFSAKFILSYILYVFNKFNLLNSSSFFLDFIKAYIFIFDEYWTHIWSNLISLLISY